MNNEIRINPAFAGEHQVLSIAFVHRNQWFSQNYSPIISTFTTHTLLKKNIGLGTILTNMNTEFYNDFTLSIPFSYKFNFENDKSLSFGLSTGFGFQKISIDKTSDVKDQDDSVINQLNSNTSIGVVLGSGIFFRSSKIELGLSAPEMIKPQLNQGVNLFRHILLYGKYNYQLNYNWNIYPSFFLQSLSESDKRKNFQGFIYDLTLTLSYNNALYVGMSYKSTSFLSFLINLKITSNLLLGYSYDFPIQNSNTLGISSQEIIVNFLFHKKGISSLWKELNK